MATNQLHHTSSTPNFSPEPFKAALRMRKSKTAEVLERERLLLPHLPKEDVVRGPIHSFLRIQFHKLILLVIHTLYSIYLRMRWAYHAVLNRVFSVLYYHHRTPQLIQQDVQELRDKGKLPKHLSVILDCDRDGLDKLVEEVSEIACWCASAGIPKLSVYERTGAASLPRPRCRRGMANIDWLVRCPQVLHHHHTPLDRPAAARLLWPRAPHSPRPCPALALVR